MSVCCANVLDWKIGAWRLVYVQVKTVGRVEPLELNRSLWGGCTECEGVVGAWMLIFIVRVTFPAETGRTPLPSSDTATAGVEFEKWVNEVSHGN